MASFWHLDVLTSVRILLQDFNSLKSFEISKLWFLIIYTVFENQSRSLAFYNISSEASSVYSNLTWLAHGNLLFVIEERSIYKSITNDVISNWTLIPPKSNIWKNYQCKQKVKFSAIFRHCVLARVLKCNEPTNCSSDDLLKGAEQAFKCWKCRNERNV